VNFQQLVTTEFGTRAWLALGAVPPRMGYAFGRWLTRQLYRRKQGVVYRVLFDNQQRILGPRASEQDVDAAVAAVLRHAGITNYDMVRTLRGGEAAIVESIDLHEQFWPAFLAARATGRGILICGCHLSNFNLGFLSFAAQSDIPVQVLSATATAGGFGVMGDLRSRGALEDTPISPTALKKAMTRLREGGAAVIGVDWPLPDATDHAPFFGQSSLLSSGFIRLALNAGALLLPMGARWTPQRGYHALTCPAMELERTGNRDRDIAVNAQRLFSIVENWIRQAPDQWLMYHPIWPPESQASPQL
jgi:KDO2-lipid IV(A) lauroyltransferase